MSKGEIIKAREMLIRVKERLINESKFKPESFTVIDALLNEFTIHEVEKLQKELEVSEAANISLAEENEKLKKQLEIAKSIILR